MKLRNIERFFKKVGRKIYSLTKEDQESVASDPLKALRDNGNLVVGANTVIDNLNIHNNELERGMLNVTIGEDCHIMGQIEMYSKDVKVTIGNRVSIGPNTKLFCRHSITIEDDVMISWGCTLIDTNAHSLKSEERKDDVIQWKQGPEFKNWNVAETKGIIVKSKSWIGFNTIVTKGVVIGEGTIVGCGSVVTKSTKSFTVVGGNPAMFIKDTV